LTEKSSLLAALNKYVFKVAKNSGKTDIKKAIEKMYKVKVAKVAISFGRSKARKVGKYEGEKTGFKKAIVTLVEGDKIDIIS
jgi:large subunit ribosomal protein L23